MHDPFDDPVLTDSDTDMVREDIPGDFNYCEDSAANNRTPASKPMQMIHELPPINEIKDKGR